jgi:hypothetical protein
MNIYRYIYIYIGVNASFELVSTTTAVLKLSKSVFQYLLLCKLCKIPKYSFCTFFTVSQLLVFILLLCVMYPETKLLDAKKMRKNVKCEKSLVHREQICTFIIKNELLLYEKRNGKVLVQNLCYESSLHDTRTSYKVVPS